MVLKEDIKSIREGIMGNEFSNEAAVAQGIVLRILNALSWPTYNMHVVRPQYSVEGGRVDFALCPKGGKPKVFIEVKQIGQGEGKERQLFDYAARHGVPLAILTTGQEWNFYLPLKEGSMGERHVYKLDIFEREVDECVSRLERYLHYDKIVSGDALQAAEDDYKNVARDRDIRKALPKAWANLIENEDEILLELIADQVADICNYKPDVSLVADFLKKKILPDLRVTEVPSEPPRKRHLQPNPIVRKTSRSYSTGEIGFTLYGKFYPARNARSVLVGVFETLSNRDPAFPERFASLPKHGSKRRYLAKTPSELFPDRPDLERESIPLDNGWWVGVNLSKLTISKVIRMACEVAGIRFGKDLIVNLGE